jgi:hypothetical protein
MHSYLHKILFLKKKKVGVTLDQYGGSLPTWLHYSPLCGFFFVL